MNPVREFDCCMVATSRKWAHALSQYGSQITNKEEVLPVSGSISQWASCLASFGHPGLPLMHVYYILCHGQPILSVTKHNFGVDTHNIEYASHIWHYKVVYMFIMVDKMLAYEAQMYSNRACAFVVCSRAGIGCVVIGLFGGQVCTQSKYCLHVPYF